MEATLTVDLSWIMLGLGILGAVCRWQWWKTGLIAALISWVGFFYAVYQDNLLLLAGGVALPFLGILAFVEVTVVQLLVGWVLRRFGWIKK